MGAVTEQQVTYAGLKGALAKAKLNTENKLAGAKKVFQAKLMTLTNVVNANNVKYEVGINKLTDVAHDWKLVSKNERGMLKDQIMAMEKDLNKAIVKAIEIGEAKAHAVQERALRVPTSRRRSWLVRSPSRSRRWPTMSSWPSLRTVARLPTTTSP